MKFVASRLLASAPVVVIVGVLVFLLIHLTPGDPAALMLGDTATPGQVRELRHSMGLDQPIWSQFLRWFAHLGHGDFGTSIVYQEPVTSVIRAHVSPTLSLTLVALVMSVVLGVGAAMLSMLTRGGWLENSVLTGATLCVSVPNFWAALMLISVFAVHLRVLPVGGYAPLGDGVGPWFTHLVLPGFTLAFQQAGLVARMLHDGMIDVLRAGHVRTARAKGAREWHVLRRHVLRNALIPTITVIGSNLGGLLGGAVVTETVFVIPGIGNLVVHSISTRDYPVLAGTVMVVAVTYVVVNLFVDILYTTVDPRMKRR